MANQKGETTSIGHFYNRCVDAVNNLFDTMSFWTHSKDVEFVDGKTAETKVGAINGITSDLNCEDESIAISAKAVNASLGGKVSNFTSGNYKAVTGLAYDDTNNKLGLKVGADTVIPFSQQSSIKKYSYNTNGTYVISSDKNFVMFVIQRNSDKNANYVWTNIGYQGAYGVNQNNFNVTINNTNNKITLNVYTPLTLITVE